MRPALVLVVFLLLSSVNSFAAFVPDKASSAVDSAAITTTHTLSFKTQHKRPGFFQRIAIRMAMKQLTKHHKIVDQEKADRLANTSLTLGIIALALAVVPFFTLLAAIPLGIIAMTTGRRAIESGTTKMSNAKLGKSLGLAALIVVGVWLIVSVVAIAVFIGSFN